MRKIEPGILVFVFIAAIVVRVGTIWISPIHEVMHVLLAFVQGQTVTKLTFDSVTIVGRNDTTLIGAYFCELGLYLFAVLISGRGKLATWSLGVVHALLYQAVFSMDLADFPTARASFVCLWIMAAILGWGVMAHRWGEKEPTTVRAW